MCDCLTCPMAIILLSTFDRKNNLAYGSADSQTRSANANNVTSEDAAEISRALSEMHSSYILCAHFLQLPYRNWLPSVAAHAPFLLIYLHRKRNMAEDDFSCTHTSRGWH